MLQSKHLHWFFGAAMNLYSETGGYNILKVSSNDCEPRGTFDPKTERSATITLLLQICYAVRIHLGSLQLQIPFAMGSTQTHDQTELGDRWISLVLSQCRLCAKSQVQCPVSWVFLPPFHCFKNTSSSRHGHGIYFFKLLY